LVVLVLLSAARGARAQALLSEAQSLYASAAYEDALVLLDRLRATAGEPEESRTIEQYRAFCLLALDRTEDAEQAIEAIFAIDPTFMPATDELSPRLLMAFSDVRQRTLPTMIRKNYLEAKVAYDRTNYLEAAARFGQILGVIERLDAEMMAGEPLLGDLQILSESFRDLSLAAAAPPLPPPEPEPPPEVQPVVAAVAPAPPWPIIYGPHNADVVPPIAESQTLPQYQGLNRNPERGLLEVVIDETGAVESAAMLTPIDPAYDRLAVQAARSWQFQPAALNGVPVKYRKTIYIDVKR
jgi:TonB family protein